MTNARHTPLYAAHLEAGAQMTEFAGWSLPARYQGVMQEHRAVRGDAGLFDVSHMCIVDITGSEAAAFLRYLLANDIGKLKQPGKALYTCMLNEDGGILDDLIVYYLANDHYRLVVNAATADQDLHWLHEHSQAFAHGKLQISRREDLALLALQGPNAEKYLCQQLQGQQLHGSAAKIQHLQPFTLLQDDQYCIARTGYTGEDGFEIMLDSSRAPAMWHALCKAGVTPCGLGARDTLRLEAGLCLYGQDMDESITPLQCGLGWTVAWEPAERDFIGRQALTSQRELGVEEKLVGLVLDQRNVLRSGYKVYASGDKQIGVLTSGTFSPTISKPIGMARVDKAHVNQDRAAQVLVEIRGRKIAARVVKPVFVRQGKIMPGLIEPPAGA